MSGFIDIYISTYVWYFISVKSTLQHEDISTHTASIKPKQDLDKRKTNERVDDSYQN